MNTKWTDIEVLTIYNTWAGGQRTVSGFENPYFQVEQSVIALFSQRQLKMLEKVKNTTHKDDTARGVWEILSQNIRRFRPTQNQKKSRALIDALKYKPQSVKERSTSKRSLLVSERLCKLDWLGTHARLNGFQVSDEYLLWYESNGLILPLAKNTKHKQYSLWQLHSLVQIDEWKRKTLEYPISSRNASPMLWQEFLLLNKETIIQSSKEWVLVVELLMDVRDLIQSMIDYAARDIWATQGNGPIRSKTMNDYLDHYAAISGEHYAEKIGNKHKDLSDERIRSWVNSLVTQAFHLNPLLQKAHEFPAMLLVAQKHQNQMDVLGVKTGVRNPVKLANWYLKAAQYLAYYLQCRTGGKIIEPAIIPILSMHYETVDTGYCLICHQPFEKTPRRGGRTQKLCGKKECKRENDCRGGKERRKRKKK